MKKVKKLKAGRKFRKICIDKFVSECQDVFGIYITEICKMKLLSLRLKQMRYSIFQKWFAANLMIGCSKNGNNFLSKILTLPSPTTISRYLQNLHSEPGITPRNIKMLKLKVNPSNDRDMICFILLDEMTIRCGYQLDRKSGSICGFCDYGNIRSCTKADSELWQPVSLQNGNTLLDSFSHHQCHLLGCSSM